MRSSSPSPPLTRCNYQSKLKTSVLTIISIKLFLFGHMKGICENSGYFTKPVHLTLTLRYSPFIHNSPHGHLQMNIYAPVSVTLEPKLPKIHQWKETWQWVTCLWCQGKPRTLGNAAVRQAQTAPRKPSLHMEKNYGSQVWNQGKKGHIFSVFSQHSSLHGKNHRVNSNSHEWEANTQ